MNAISIAEIYEEILKYYRESDMRSAIEESEKAFTAYQKRIHESYPKPPTITWNVSWLNAIGFDAPFLLLGFNNNSNPKFKSDKTENQWKAFSEDEYVDLVENELESVMRKLKKNFRYLMRNVLFQKMEDFKLKGTRGSYFIYKKDAPIIKTLLLHSVSENELDAIIRKWFSGKIPENAYDEIVLLSNRLTPAIFTADVVIIVTTLTQKVIIICAGIARVDQLLAMVAGAAFIIGAGLTQDVITDIAVVVLVRVDLFSTAGTISDVRVFFHFDSSS